jgi:hypothetical protein
VALVTSTSGLGTTGGLLLAQLRQTRPRHAPDFVFVVFLLPLHGFQLINSVLLIDRPASTGALQTAAILVVVCFLVGIARAWELLGVRRTGLVHTALALRRMGPTAVGVDRGAPAGPDPIGPGPSEPPL